MSAQLFDETDIKNKVRKIVAAVRAAAERVPEPAKAPLEQAADKFDTALALTPDRIKWAENAVGALQTLRKAIAAADTDGGAQSDTARHRKFAF